jgi:deoxyhypusine monooxygenase
LTRKKKLFLNISFLKQAAEAMGAISDPSSVPILQEYLTDPERTVRETCEIAMAKIEWDNTEEGKRHYANLNEPTFPYVSSHFYSSPLL